MMPGLANGKTATGKLFDLIADTMTVWARARAAADQYEELKPLSDQALAEMGIKRAELPRAVWKKLCGSR
jgi:hypothetical protein